MLVLRQYERAEPGLIAREAGVLRAVHAAGLPAPEPIAADGDGLETDGHPAILMTRVPGRVDLAPADPEGWLRQMAAMAARIHEVRVDAGAFLERFDAGAPVVPGSAERPEVWEAAFEVLRAPAPEYLRRFIHRDFQHFNVLWRRGRLSGVVDWATSCSGPAEFDIGHCRLNLAVLFGAEWAERYRLAYEAEAGRAVEPWWDLYALAGYGDMWKEFIPVQVGTRAAVDVVGMTGRVEELVAAVLRRT